jgi:hypothetical protein
MRLSIGAGDKGTGAVLWGPLDISRSQGFN